MTVLVDWEILDLINTKTINIEPFCIDNINPNSLDLKLGNEFIRFLPGNLPIDPYSDFTEYKRFTVPDIIIRPGSFLLGTTLETVTLPDNICAEITGKSSIARFGVELHKTAGWIDAGFSGKITLEIQNCGNRSVKLYPGMEFAQLIFHKTEKCNIDYGMRKKSKYQNQTGATPSRYYLNKLI